MLRHDLNAVKSLSPHADHADHADMPPAENKPKTPRKKPAAAARGSRAQAATRGRPREARGAHGTGHGQRARPGRDAYHHGALREALIEATEALLAERGAEGFSLREVARRSGVSPAAPAHHFGDAEGLLTAVATLAFAGLTEALEAGNERGGSDPVARLREQGLGYVGFALRYPGRFGLMFRTGPGGVRKDEALERSAHAAFMVLEDGVRGLLGVPATAPLSPVHWQAILATWSVVHGFAHLALAGQLDQVAQGARSSPRAQGAQGGSVAPAADCGAGTGAGRGAREALLREVLAPLLEQQLRGLLQAQPRLATSGSR